MDKKIILQKFIVDSGHCSRRQATELIRSGRVKVNDKMAELGQKVLSNDKVQVGEKILKIEIEKIYIILNKPICYICTNRKFKGEKNIFDLIENKNRLFVVGRLDKDSRGLVLITNDGDMTERITHPRYEHEKEYVVQLRIKNEELRIKEIASSFLKGIDISEGDGVVKAKVTEYLGQGKFKIILTSGKKRQIRRMFEILDLEIVDLVRVRIGNIELGELKIGEWRHLSDKEIKNLNVK
ncbi:rRNA pseudouridine synthase [Candidatus Parcubacteria bacterium]|nr:rRNA pseudouridine synthase [Candidatus Parcubacteria bacterium]